SCYNHRSTRRCGDLREVKRCIVLQLDGSNDLAAIGISAKKHVAAARWLPRKLAVGDSDDPRRAIDGNCHSSGDLRAVGANLPIASAENARLRLGRRWWFSPAAVAT